MGGVHDIRYTNPYRHAQGAIVRIRLENFVTYSSVEFRPGPHLNMVLGPNGTGKSTIVCAIALGLGGKPEVIRYILGRAKEVRDFVRKLKAEAVIEIELKGDTANVIVERRLHAANNRSTWSLDGRVSTEAAVKERITRMNIQVDNLWYPFDDDSRLILTRCNLLKLLQETERAVGSPKLLQQHMELIRLRNELKGLEVSAAGDHTHLAMLQKKVGGLEEEVARLREKERCLQEIRIIELAIPWERYEIALKFNAAKRAYDNYSSKLREANNDIEKAEERQRSESSSLKSSKQRLSKAIQNLKNFKATLKGKKEELEKFQDDLRERGYIDDNGRFDATRSQEYIDIMREIERISSEVSDCAGDVATLQSKQKEVVAEKVTIDRRKHQVEGELTRLHETSSQKIEAVRRASPDTFSVLEWFRRNRETNEVSFENVVFEPICLHVNVTRPEYAAALESQIGRGSLMNWVVQSRNDYKMLTGQIFDVMRKRCNVVLLNERSEYHPPIPREELRSMGFDGYMIDFVQAPREILDALCQLTGLHSVCIVDSEAESRLNDELHNLEPRKRALEEKLKALAEEDGYLRKRDQALRHTEVKIEGEEAEIRLVEEEIHRLKTTLQQHITRRSQLSLAVFNNKAVRAFEARTLAALKDIELLSKKKFIEEKMNSLRERHSAIEAAWANSDELYSVALTLNGKLQKLKHIREGRTLPDLEDMLGQSRARAEILACSNTRAQHEYNELTAEIATYTQKIDKRNAKIDKFHAMMRNIQENWFPELQRLIQITSEAFSKSFEKIGCAGEVKIHEDEDYEKWGINILVKFRENEKLQALTAHRQSGGVSQAPFRVVDEINQGMDPRNERMVHTQIVDTACGEGNSQYFLITPKLLPDLAYHERMKVLVIYNGEHQPKEFNFRHFIDQKKASGKQKKLKS
ncbi:hypothetical protein BC829DRAFT_413866 [Chytridium lagenaria]|nr:hypothetical protein BC829DRAFT_413866 [Chytridium lagenaria]